MSATCRSGRTHPVALRDERNRSARRTAAADASPLQTGESTNTAPNQSRCAARLRVNSRTFSSRIDWAAEQIRSSQ